jgi:uncharacterized protein (DUF3084 family)
MKDKGKLIEDADTQVLKEKLARYETSLQLEAKNIQASKKEVKDKDADIKKLREQLAEQTLLAKDAEANLKA